MSDHFFSAKRGYMPGSPLDRMINTEFQKRRIAKGYVPPKGLRSNVKTAPRMNSTNAQAIRTGGWANPSKGGEVKFVDTSATINVAFGSSAFSTPVLLNGLINGSDASTRIGRKITLKSVLVRGSWALGATSTGGSPLRVMVVYDKQANAAAPTQTDILLANEFVSQNNLSNRDRFVTVFDQLVDPISVQGDYSTACQMFKRVNLETMFNAGSAGTIGDIASGSLWLMVAQTGLIGTANAGFIYRTRVRYTDV